MMGFITRVSLLFIFLFSSTCCVHVSDSSLKSFSEKLLQSDTNNVGQLLNIDIQNRLSYESTNDLAPKNLFSIQKDIFSGSTISKLMKLYDNYDLNAFNNELITAEERREEEALLEAFVNTTVMIETKKFLQSNNLIPKNENAFKKMLADLWFTPYSRGKKKVGSSAFEHIFLAELKNNELVGLHNWLYFSHEENRGNLNYLGWLKKLFFPNKHGNGVLKLKYSWGKSVKHAGTIFFGTSPEFEMCLYTVCFLARPNDKCHITLDGKQLYIQTYPFVYQGKTLISSAYPVI